MLANLFKGIMKSEEVKVTEVVKIDNWKTGKDFFGNWYIENKVTHELIYCPSGESEAEKLANYYNKL